MAPGEPRLSATGLYDVCLTLTLQGRVVRNALNADGKRLVIITGASQGGKSTFLRSVGVAQLMMQCGMFVAAEGFYLAEMDSALFLRAERQPDGRRTFRLVEGKPLPTSFGEDSYRRIFGKAFINGQYLPPPRQ